MSTEVKLKGNSLRARQNVVHEVGLFKGRLAFEKIILVRHVNYENLSNLNGLNEIQYDPLHCEPVLAKIRAVAEREGLIPRRE